MRQRELTMKEALLYVMSNSVLPHKLLSTALCLCVFLAGSSLNLKTHLSSYSWLSLFKVETEKTYAGL